MDKGIGWCGKGGGANHENIGTRIYKGKGCGVCVCAIGREVWGGFKTNPSGSAYFISCHVHSLINVASIQKLREPIPQKLK